MILFVLVLCFIFNFIRTYFDFLMILGVFVGNVGIREDGDGGEKLPIVGIEDGDGETFWWQGQGVGEYSPLFPLSPRTIAILTFERWLLVFFFG